MSNTNNAYRYVPLAADGSTFRVVYLLPGSELSRFECDFLEVPITAHSGFSALSYTWGDDTVVSQIFVHGRTIGITSSLKNALKRLRHADEPCALWVDALCISQIDKVEKNTQIPLMSHIYGSTQLVTIYLGTEENGSENIPKLCRAIHDVFGRSGIIVEVGKRPPDDRQLAVEDYARCGLPERKDEAWDQFRAFVSRAWFRRIWIIQEACLAKKAEVICGKWRMSFRDLMLAVYYAQILDLPIFPKADVIERNVSIQILGFMHWLGAAQSETKRLKLLYLLDRCRKASATDPHDYCYGLMGLAADGNSPLLKPDYFRPVRDDYLQFAKYFISQGDGIVVLYNAGRQTLHLPSWVPDWSHRDPEYLPLCPNPAARPETVRIYTASLGAEPSLRLDTSRPNSLIVRGVIFDPICAVGRTHTRTRDFSSERRRRIVSTVNRAVSPELYDIGTPDGALYWQKVIEFQLVADYVWDLQLLLQIFQNQLSYPTGEDLETVVWRTAICNSSGSAGQKAPATYSNLYQAFKQLIHLYRSSWPKPTEAELRDAVGPRREESISSMNKFVQIVLSLCHGRRMCRSTRGYVGQIPLSSQIGDIIFLPLGSAVPFIARPQGSEPETYKLIGECYIHGIMDGELIQSKTANFRDFILV